MTIIISKNGKNSEKIDQSNFELEDRLQSYIYDNPDTIPLYEIDKDISKEFTTKSGPIDALGFDESGNIYVVETKLYKNPDKRTVVAQALDYGASLWRNSTNFDDFIQQLNVYTEKQFGVTFQDKYTEFFGLEEASENIKAIKENLSEGVIKFVVLMDKLHDALKDLVIFVNQNSKFDLYAVELEYYRHAEFEIIIPKLFGAEVKKDVSSASERSNPNYMTKATFDDFKIYVEKHYEDDELSAIGKQSVLKLAELYIELTKKTGGTNSYWRAQTNFRDVIKLIVNGPNKVSMYLDSDSSFGAYPGNKSGKQIDFTQTVLKEMIKAGIMKRTDKHLQGSQWFTNFKKSSTSDKEIKEFMDINEKVFKTVIEGQ